MQQQEDSAGEGDIISLIHDVASQFRRSSPDVQNIQSTMQDIRETEKVRREILQEAWSSNQKMMRDLKVSRQNGVREYVDPESAKYEQWMEELEEQKFVSAKAIQELDQEISSLEAELHQLRMESLELDSSYKSSSAGAESRSSSHDRNLSSDEGFDGINHPRKDQSEIESNDDEGDDIMDDTAHAAAALRLQLYRGLGFEVLEDELGAYSKARIRSTTGNDVHLVKLDDRLSPYYQTNLIWDLAS
ncbi:MAG: hypothetical protein J3Q66DRAFT_321869 [Benniella sp.]|nr:MAG: hypothetical protein J3Q66DRAFT_321869 [Benniella sp.]